MVRRPIACATNEIALASPIPGLPPRETIADLDRALAGPPPFAEEAGQPAAAAAPVALETLPPDTDIPFSIPGTPPIGGLFPPPLGPPGTPPPVVGPPVTPPDTPPPDTPPVVIPPSGPPVIVTPPDTPPPEVFPPPPTPPTGPGPGPGGGAPEPGVWLMLTVGFGVLGVRLRERRAAVRAQA